MLNDLKNNLNLINVKIRFIKDIINKILKINNVAKKEIIIQLEKLKYPKMINSILYELDSNEFKNITKKNESENSFGNYDFLIRLPIYSLTKEKIEELENEFDILKKKRTDLFNKTIPELWNNDLTEFEKKYTKFMDEYYKYFDMDKKDFEKKKGIK